MQTPTKIGFILFAFITFLNCTPNPIYRQEPLPAFKEPIPKVKHQQAIAVQIPVVQSTSSVDTVQIDTVSNTDSWDLQKQDSSSIGIASQESFDKKEAVSGIAPHRIHDAKVRVLIIKNAKEVSIATIGDVQVRSNKSTTPFVSFRGNATIVKGRGSEVVLDIGGNEKRSVSLPCTLYCENELNIVKIHTDSYRGSIIIAADHDAFSVINYVNVEDYLRGVVPLEVGKGNDEVIEAVKAQAVAARTYTYKKMRENTQNSYDLLSSVSDQVYGGVASEFDICNQAISATAGEVIVYHDSLIYAYYYSTCGGKTANINDVWNKSFYGYLRSVDDGGSNAFCAGSNAFTWEEKWPIRQFSSIVNRYSRETFPKNVCKGDVQTISINQRFSCGRVKEMVIHTSQGSFTYGGDKIRFVVRRNVAGFPILKSSAVTDVAVKNGVVEMHGKGYGHGVGMCQMGALARAKKGQLYIQILQAYYSGIDVKNIATE